MTQPMTKEREAEIRASDCFSTVIKRELEATIDSLREELKCSNATCKVPYKHSNVWCDYKMQDLVAENGRLKEALEKISNRSKDNMIQAVVFDALNPDLDWVPSQDDEDAK